MNKKAMSQVVTTVIFISLALIAIGIVWTVINNLVQSGTDDVEIQSKCVKISLNIESATCNATTGTCNVTVSRSAGGGEIEGAVVIVSDGSNSDSIEDQFADLGTLESRTELISYSSNTVTGAPTSIKVAAHFDVNGVNEYCPQVAEYSLA
jgi:hypothetical protein